MRLVLLLCGACCASAWLHSLPLSEPTRKAVRAKSLPFPLINDATSLDEAIRDGKEGSSLVVLFHKDQCRRCQRIKPLVGRLAHETAATGSTLRRFAQVDGAEPSGQALCTAEGVQTLPHLRVYRIGTQQHLRCDVSIGPRGTGPVLGFAELRRTVENCATCETPPEERADASAGVPLDAAAVMTALPLSLIAVLSSLGERIAGDLGVMAA